MDDKKIAVIGGGSWATALVKILCNNFDEVHWWMRNQEAVEHLRRFNRNPRYLTSVQFDSEKIRVTDDLQKTLKEADILVMATPSAFLVELFDTVSVQGLENKIIISAIKGIIPEYHAIPARFFHKTFGVPYEQIGIICGPCHAEEVALEKLSYLTVACPDTEMAQWFSEKLACRYIQVGYNDDLFGTEIAAVLKNVFSVASGICHGLGYGDNFQAVLIANALQEMKRFIDAVNPTHRDVKSSAYLGDLLVTAYSQFSRNRTFGSMIGRGYSVKSAQFEMNMVAEGYYAVKSIVEMNKRYKVDMPITNMVFNIVYEKISPVVEVRILVDLLS